MNHEQMTCPLFELQIIHLYKKFLVSKFTNQITLVVNDIQEKNHGNVYI